MDGPDNQSQDLTARLDELLSSALVAVNGAGTLDELSDLDTAYLGRTAELAQLKATLRDLDPAARPSAGQAINSARTALAAAFGQRREELAAMQRRESLEKDGLDLSEVRLGGHVGHLHPVTQVWQLLEDTFVGMGYAIAEGPEIESDWYNFGALNLPANHPARSMWDTLYLDPGPDAPDGADTFLLRTHTSPVQIRTMLDQAPPIYIVAPGRVFRRDTADATHLPVFHQIEGLVIDRHIDFTDLAGTIDVFVKALFGEDRSTRLRPSYFPFTEPSAEFDMSTADGGWIELGGCGMVHPNVLSNCGIDPEEWSGFAFGFGIDRMARETIGLDDLREFVANDIRFLRQF